MVPVPLKARPGWFVQLPIIGGLNQPFFLVSPYRAHIRSAHARLRPLRRLRGILLMGAAPLLVQGGDFGFPSSCLQCPRVQQKDVGHGKSLAKEGWAAPSRKMARRHLVWRGRGGSSKLPLE